MGQSDATNYFRDLCELGADPSMSLAEKIDRAVTVGRDRLDIPYGALTYTGAGRNEIVESTCSEGAYAAGSARDLEATWCRHVVDDQELLAIPDAGDSDYAADAARDATDLQCYVGAPVLVDGEVYGTLCYAGPEPRGRPFTDDEKRFVRLLSRWIGQELERERHYRMLDRQNERLNEFAGVLAHDLRNALTSARGYTELVAESATDPEAEHLRTALDALDRVDTLVDDTLSLVREGANVGERESVALGDLARSAWETVDPERATLVVEDDREVLADPSRLRQLLEHLFRNAVEHCLDGVTVTVRGTESGFVVADDGPGLPEEIAQGLFGGTFGSGQVGLGLLAVERIVSGHGWHGAVDVADGTRFAITGVGTVTEKSPVE